ncbi:ATP-binding cassette domain-containing protein [Amycolatopsis thermalba]|uniref:ATP-binding cassette domain-containing protein n=1 Tax=Amycolatopsis thermalba TaxID=944492 RepID=A0ABY4P0L9_9PSEU|nr:MULTISPECIES: ATP-binding cassette domain-containing protein [Amycolatopsis]OXM64582.1 cell division protein FtsE [Amycolatopsis sp. KNN50.9b]UQS25872.1 ATP-binding cassette domain-containing protein [Amycolatopsis thermalba]
MLSLRGVRKSYGGTPALRPVDLDLVAGELVVLTGPSGSGKSTLLMIAGGWETPDGGEIVPRPPLPEVPVDRMSWRDLGFVPQSISLFEELTLADNLALARGGPGGAELLEALELGHLAARRPGEVSRGEQQRAAVARALVAAPSLVIADEPTSHQDHRRARLVLDLLRAAAVRGAAVLIASHDAAVVSRADREIRLDAPAVAPG